VHRSAVTVTVTVTVTLTITITITITITLTLTNYGSGSRELNQCQKSQKSGIFYTKNILKLGIK